MEDLEPISRGVYSILCGTLGSQSIVDMRRRVMALQQKMVTMLNRCDISHEDAIMTRGRCEGFRIASSDVDVMRVRRHLRALFSIEQYSRSNAEHTLLIAECNNTKPGFAYLRSIHDSSYDAVRHSTVELGGHSYISSAKWRDFFLPRPSVYSMHGPCSTTVAGTIDVDYAYSIKADTFPHAVHGFIRRLLRASCPSEDLVYKIASGGCHFVAIGAKESPSEALEWRMSFTATEKILLHAMNHVQFLCYGLLKIVLKEAIDVNIDVKGLFCSYFLNTAVLWGISTNDNLKWDPPNFLICFGHVFKEFYTG